MIPEPVIDAVTGMFFWRDEAALATKRIYHGQIVASLEGGYYLLAFTPCEELPSGIHEIAHISTMTEQKWSLFLNEESLMSARSDEST